MNDRHTADTITSDALDQLYERLDRARDATALHRHGLLTTAELYAVIEAAPESGPAATQATGIRGLLEHVGIDTSGRDITVAGKVVDADPDDPPVQCWHTEANTPCDWDVCKQPERLAAGDYGTDPREQH